MSENKKVFISGPMSGIKDFNKPEFDKAEQWLTQAGYSVFNPARMHFDDAWTHEEIMRIDLAALAQCDYILMLDGWQMSRGAMQEYLYAMTTGIEMIAKKESKPKQCINIETFGDISGENLDFLMWVEKNCNEILAKDGKLTEAVEVQIDNTTHDILRMMVLFNGHKPPKRSCDTCKYENNSSSLGRCLRCNSFKNWEPKPTSDAPEKSCKACKYSRYTMDEEPCKSCDPVHTNWKPKYVPKLCDTCKHYTCSLSEEPCKSCNAMFHTKWEPKDAEK